MTNNIMTVKSSHNEDFGSLIEKLVHKTVEKLFFVYITRFEIFSHLSKAKDILTTKEVAELLGMNERVVREKINLGLIPAYKPSFSNKFLVLRNDLLREIKSGMQYKSVSMMNSEVNKQFDSKQFV